jgi:hypothetical protein
MRCHLKHGSITNANHPSVLLVRINEPTVNAINYVGVFRRSHGYMTKITPVPHSAATECLRLCQTHTHLLIAEQYINIWHDDEALRLRLQCMESTPFWWQLG